MFTGVLNIYSKGVKTLAFINSYIPTAFSQTTVFAVESGFLSFLELQKSLLVSFTWVLNTMAIVLQGLVFINSYIPTVFSQNTFLLIKWLSFITRAPEIPTSKFSAELNTIAKVWKLHHTLFLRYSTTFP